ncbi:MAG: hypothetical protein HY208_05410 [Nitrospirae bacterium]|nr:hypothetical protein [Nitrospirota bacterium]
MTCLCLTVSGCGVSTEIHARTLHERDQYRDRAGQAEAEAAAQRRQAVQLQAAVMEQRQTNDSLKARVTELEAQTADQGLAQEALSQQLRAVTAEREELLLKLDESEPPHSPSSASQPPDGTGHPKGRPQEGGADRGGGAQRLATALHDAIEAGHVTMRSLADGLVLQLAASFLFMSDKAVLTTEGQRTLSIVTTTLAVARPRRLQIRMGVNGGGESGRADQESSVRLVVFNRGMALLRQCDAGGLVSSELVLVALSEDKTTTIQASPPPAQPVRQDEIQIVVDWSAAP